MLIEDNGFVIGFLNGVLELLFGLKNIPGAYHIFSNKCNVTLIHGISLVIGKKRTRVQLIFAWWAIGSWSPTLCSEQSRGEGGIGDPFKANY